MPRTTEAECELTEGGNDFAVAALAASIYTWLTYQLVRAQAEPRVVVYACTDPNRLTIINDSHREHRP
jgi:hypothetical protein